MDANPTSSILPPQQAHPSQPSEEQPGFHEFVALIAIMMAVSAFSIDNLLPAFDTIRAAFQVADPNRPQLLVYGYMIALALGQIAYGPLADIYGRRRTFLAGMGIFAAGTLMAIVADSFEILLLSRVVQGLGSAAARVLAVTIVRDRYSGREMARVMSLAMMVFLTVPVFAPAIGGVLLLLGGWRTIFVSMLALCVILVAWFGLRMPETLHPQYRMAFSASRIAAAVRLTVTTRVSAGYTLAIGLIMGCLMSYVGSAQQILETSVYGLGPIFSVYFGAIAAVMAVASLLNSWLVRGIGMRRLSHAGICGFVFIAGLQLAAALNYRGHPPLPLFMMLLALNFFLFGLTVPNFNALAMEPLGAVAGTASSVIGSFTTLLGALCGAAIGQAFDGSVRPIGIGFFILSLAALLVVIATERGRLFETRHHVPSA